jgi:hypothetical protein
MTAHLDDLVGIERCVRGAVTGPTKDGSHMCASAGGYAWPTSICMRYASSLVRASRFFFVRVDDDVRDLAEDDDGSGGSDSSRQSRLFSVSGR